MKTVSIEKMLIAWLVLIASVGIRSLNAQQLEAEVPGDHFSLEGALAVFRKSSSPKEFEKLLNQSESKVNNLDLNGDGQVDYVRVISQQEGNIFIFILQAVISATESQDVAVIELEKLENGEAILQITGDADIYGIQMIIEPTEEVYVNAGTTTRRRVVNVWTWPVIQYVYSPYYSVWVSPWGWHDWPWWWTSWRPVAYYVYYPWWRPYSNYYTVCYTHRIDYYHTYRPYRTTSVIVHNRYQDKVQSYRSRRGGERRYETDINDISRRYPYARDRESQSNGHVNTHRSFNRAEDNSEEHRYIRKNSSGSFSPGKSSTSDRVIRNWQPQERTSVMRTDTEERKPNVSRTIQRNEIRQPARHFESTNPPVRQSAVHRQPVQRQITKPSVPVRRTISRPGPKATPNVPAKSGGNNSPKKRKNWN